MKIIFNSQFRNKDYSNLWKMFLVKHLCKSDLKDIFHFVEILLVLPISDYQLLGAKEECTSSIALHVKATGHSIKWDFFKILASRKTDYLSKIKESFFVQELNPNPKYYVIYF